MLCRWMGLPEWAAIMVKGVGAAAAAVLLLVVRGLGLCCSPEGRASVRGRRLVRKRTGENMLDGNRLAKFDDNCATKIVERSSKKTTIQILVRLRSYVLQ